MTLQLANGSTVTIDLSGTTTYHSETSAASTDVKTGSTVLVQIDTAALASGQPNGAIPGSSAAPGASGAPAINRTLTAKDVLITTP